MKSLALLSLAGTMASAQTKPVDPVAPKLSDAQRASYFKAVAEYQEAQQQTQQLIAQKQLALTTAVTDITKVCGKNFVPTLRDGEPKCEIKPPAPQASAERAAPGTKK